MVNWALLLATAVLAVPSAAQDTAVNSSDVSASDVEPAALNSTDVQGHVLNTTDLTDFAAIAVNTTEFDDPNNGVNASALTAVDVNADPFRGKQKMPLRMMAVGAEVTFGVGSTTGDSYRKNLRDALVRDGFQVNMVGESRNGRDFTDNDVQATSGFTINQISQSTQRVTSRFRPNVVLIEAGTNDCNNGNTATQAGNQITNMINDVFRQSPGATVILATLGPNRDARQEACLQQLNRQIQGVASNFQRSSARFLLADIRSSGGLTVNDLSDSRHPNNNGYQKMANIFHNAITQAFARNTIQRAARVNGIADNGDSSSNNNNNNNRPFGAVETNNLTDATQANTQAGVSTDNSAPISAAHSLAAPSVLGLLLSGVLALLL